MSKSLLSQIDRALKPKRAGKKKAKKKTKRKAKRKASGKTLAARRRALQIELFGKPVPKKRAKKKTAKKRAKKKTAKKLSGKAFAKKMAAARAKAARKRKR